MSRMQYTGRYRLGQVAGDVAAGANDNDEVNSVVFDTNLSKSPAFFVDVVDLGNNKKIAFKMQHSDSSNANFSDVPTGRQTDVNPATEIEDNGRFSYYYGGIKRYIRLVVISKTAAPGATVRVYSDEHNLAHIPDNVGI